MNMLLVIRKEGVSTYVEQFIIASLPQLPVDMLTCLMDGFSYVFVDFLVYIRHKYFYV